MGLVGLFHVNWADINWAAIDGDNKDQATMAFMGLVNFLSFVGLSNVDLVHVDLVDTAAS